MLLGRVVDVPIIAPTSSRTCKLVQPVDGIRVFDVRTALHGCSGRSNGRSARYHHRYFPYGRAHIGGEIKKSRLSHVLPGLTTVTAFRHYYADGFREAQSPGRHLE